MSDSVHPVSSFVIDRKQWLRGEGGNESMLLRSDGKMCCLGIYLEACGVDDALLADVLEPADISAYLDIPEWMQRRGDRPSDVGPVAPITAAMEVNDNEHLTDPEREEKLTAIFKAQGIEVTFK